MAVHGGGWCSPRSGMAGAVSGLACWRSGFGGTRRKSARRFGSATFPVGNTVAEERRMCSRLGVAVDLESSPLVRGGLPLVRGGLPLVRGAVRWSGERLRPAGCLRRPAEGLPERSLERDAQRSTRDGCAPRTAGGLSERSVERDAQCSTRETAETRLCKVSNRKRGSGGAQNVLLTGASVGPGSACVPQAAFGVPPKAFQSGALSETLNAAPGTGALPGPPEALQSGA